MGEGNGAGPTIWKFISTKMLKLLRCKIFGGKSLSGIRKKMDHIVGYGFVDDTYLLQNTRFEYDIIKNFTIEMKKTIDLWEGYFKAFGGALHPYKSLFIT